ncbi:MAG: retroviral-like aspartic protease family protein [Fibromonadales bacterium]|nr:retroviral-like aspartic protease family protein [Fibromonadales bacterium]
MSPKSFTIKYDSSFKTLITACSISEAFDPKDLQKGLKRPPAKEFTAIWDTGATNSVISEKVVYSLDLEPTGKEIVYHANGKSLVNTHGVNILLPNDVVFTTLKVTEGILSGIDVLIGMDIILKGDFAISSFCGKTKFSFQIPSTHDIDFSKCSSTRRLFHVPEH